VGDLGGRRLPERRLPLCRKETTRMYAVIMAGGEGARFWPVSRSNCPKPFLSILGGDPLVVQTMKRLEGLVPPERTLVLINRKQEEVARRRRSSGSAPAGLRTLRWRSCEGMRAYNQDNPGGPE